VPPLCDLANGVADDDDDDACAPEPDNLACARGDPDNDGLDNAEEALAGTDPEDADSDDDGM
jgi:hypothetical protein